MELGIGGKVAMIMAGSKGIGLATAKRLAEEGCRVSICSRSEEHLEAAVAEIGGDAYPYVCDVTNPADLEWWISTTVREVGAPEILITNTGGPPAGRFTEMTDDQWRAGVDSTLLNIVRMVRLVSPMMIEAKWGRIVHITSIVAKDPVPILPISATLRAGIMALTKLQAHEFGPHGITVNGVLPGHTMTERQTHLAEVRAERESRTPEEVLEEVAKDSPMGRLGTPDEIAAAITFLASAPASYVSGVSLLVDGAASRGLG
ncbi:MAG: SDR family oxidoreductase [Armatimonadetes bacterium]|nr:SDR family oxidoreductase [Armatimonadota bacterium]